MELTFLGTASAYPTPTRCVSGLALRFANKDSVWLFDCGEGCQVQLMKSNLKPGKVCKIFITHLHGDHVFGLPGLICTVSQNNQRLEPVQIYGPVGLRNYLRVTLGYSRSELGFDFVVHELQPVAQQLPPEKWPIHDSPDVGVHPNEKPGSVITCDDQQVWTCLRDSECTVQAVWVQHRVPCFAFVVREHDRPGSLDVDRLKSLGVPPGPLYGRIKAGETITLPSGLESVILDRKWEKTQNRSDGRGAEESVRPDDVVGESRKGLVLAVGGDSSDSYQLMKVARSADLLVHEATLENACHATCVERGHSTPKMTAELAKSLDVKQLILTHYSQRYRPPSHELKEGEESVLKLLCEAQEILGDRVTCAEDLAVFTLTPGGVQKVCPML